MKRVARLVVVPAVLAVCTVLPAAPAQAYGTCGSPVPFTGTRQSGTLDGSNLYDWWGMDLDGSAVFRLQSDSDFGHVRVYDNGCSQVLCESMDGSDVRCPVLNHDGPVRMYVSMFDSVMRYTLSVSQEVGVDDPTVPTVPAECGDGIDNDLNGVADHPGDPGCSSPTDEDESSPAPPSSCNVADTADTCVHLTTGDLYAEQAVYRVETVVTATHTVGGYVEGYRFTVPSGGSVVVPCVRLVALSASANPCQAAGGTFVSRTATLVEDVDQPWVAYGSPLATVRVCEATITITVAGFGAEGFPALTTC